MPTKTEREYYRMGFADGVASTSERAVYRPRGAGLPYEVTPGNYQEAFPISARMDKARPKRKLSAWNKFVKANSKKPRFVLRSGKLNLKKMGVAFRKTPQGKKKRR